VLARFAQEQQALARLNHPHIAHLLDAGRTDDGLPYFVMEFVHGRPIDQACDGQPLDSGWRCSCNWPTRWRTRTATCWCTATSSPATCW
jgi:serine/threonine protein kinase